MKKNPGPITEKEVSLAVQETETIIQSLDPLPNRIRKLNMNHDEDYENLMIEGRTTRDIQRKVEAKQKWVLTALLLAMKETKKRVESLFGPMLVPCKEVLELIDQRQREYFQIQDRKQEEEQKRLDVEAEEEQKRLDKNAKAKAKRLQNKGKRQQAREVIAEVPQIEAAKAEEVAAPKVGGVSRAKIWDFEIQTPFDVPETLMVLEKSSDDVQYEVSLWSRAFDRKALLDARKSLAENDLDQPIPGVRFFQKPSTRYGRL